MPDRDLLAEGRAKLAALAENPSTDRAFDLAEWAGLNLPALLDALEAAQRPPLKYIAGYRSGDYVMIDGTTAHHDDPSAARDRARYLTRRDSRAWGVYEIREVQP
jgi:hypothetical protein